MLVGMHAAMCDIVAGECGERDSSQDNKFMRPQDTIGYDTLRLYTGAMRGLPWDWGRALLGEEGEPWYMRVSAY